MSLFGLALSKKKTPADGRTILGSPTKVFFARAHLLDYAVCNFPAGLAGHLNS